VISQPPNPNLATKRLCLRPLQPEDLSDFQRLHSDPAVTRYLAPTRPLSAAESFRLFAQVLGHWQLRGYGYWAITLTDTSFIGVVGLWFPEGWPGVEIGWRLGPAFWGNGYALEAASAVRDFAFQTLELPEIISIIRADNAASVRLAERLGMSNYGTRTITEVDVATYGLSRAG
jgi:RimJ/RimL family protein N-acetyltransferase